ncbi:MAG: DUF1499 domain-containing protein [Pseudomonadota bacterium]
MRWLRLVLLIGHLHLAGCQSVRSDGPAGRMAPCGALPNCYRSGAAQPPWHLADASLAGWQAFMAELRLRERWSLITEADGYVHFLVRTPLLRFADDVEFRLALPAGTVSYRSASRLGISDLGANRQRLEALAAELVTAGLLQTVGATSETTADE